MGKKKNRGSNFFFGYSKLQQYGSDTEHRSPTAATMTGWDTSCDSEPYFDSMQTTGRVSCTCHVMLPTNRCTQSCRFCCCRAQGFLSHMCTTRITYRLPYRLLRICSYAGARAEHLLSLAQHLATHALCCGGCTFQTRNRSRHK